jgi:hypothetical protein
MQPINFSRPPAVTDAATWSSAYCKEEGHGVVFHLYELTLEHFPNFVDCRPIFIARALPL